jgi:hypothetical protein
MNISVEKFETFKNVVYTSSTVGDDEGILI